MNGKLIVKKEDALLNYLYENIKNKYIAINNKIITKFDYELIKGDKIEYKYYIKTPLTKK